MNRRPEYHSSEYPSRQRQGRADGGAAHGTSWLGLLSLALLGGAFLNCAPDPGPVGDGDGDEGSLAQSPMLVAMQRDLHLSPAQITARLHYEAVAAQLEPALRQQLGSAFAGAWMSDDHTSLVVAITDPQHADSVRQAGAEPRLVPRSLAALDQIKARLDSASLPPDASVHAWYVDPASNTIVVAAADAAAPGVTALVASLGRDAAAVRVVTSPERPRPLYDLRGGDEILLNKSALCSVGFAVDGGFVTAGHCGTLGTTTDGPNGAPLGTIAGSVFPGHDYAFVRINSSWNALPAVGDHRGGQVLVQGSSEAAINSTVCRSGRTTGWRCGLLQARNTTVVYAAGSVPGVTMTNVCAEGGDSGGSFIAGDQAQGVTSGGNGDCTRGGTTYFQPVNPILSAYGLTLKTAGGAGSGAGLVSNWNGKCIDVPGSRFDDGARLQMWDCNRTAAQQWTFSGGRVLAGGKCMDVAGASRTDGTPIQLANCNGSAAQQFVLSGAGDLVSVLANKCVDIKDWNGSNGAVLQIWSCAGSANQKWHRG